jgi:hypothetical protein
MSAAAAAPSRDAWSEQVTGLSGRLRVEFEDLDPGLRHAVYLELRNEAAQPITVSNLPDLHAHLHDSAGNPVGTSGIVVSGPQPSRRWMVVPLEAYLGFRVDMRTVGMPTRESGTALLALGGEAWRLGKGQYELRATAAFPLAEDGPADQWVGELALPPVTVVLEPEKVAAG